MGNLKLEDLYRKSRCGQEKAKTTLKADRDELSDIE